MAGIKPIETRYKGCRFRSRLEARWAVFFDALGVKWEYEGQSFVLDDTPYLPDFWLPQVRMWAEVKPGEFSDEERWKCERLAQLTGNRCMLLTGSPTGGSFEVVGDGYDYRVFEAFTDLYLDEHRWYSGANEGDDPFPEANLAAEKARSARFEFGESGAMA